MYQSSSFSALKTKKLILLKSNWLVLDWNAAKFPNKKERKKNRFNLPDNSDLGQKSLASVGLLI